MTKPAGAARSDPIVTRTWYFPAGTSTRVPAQPGADVVPDHLMLYCTAVRAGSVRTSVPSPGKQSAVDHTRAPAAV